MRIIDGNPIGAPAWGGFGGDALAGSPVDDDEAG